MLPKTRHYIIGHKSPFASSPETGCFFVDFFFIQMYITRSKSIKSVSCINKIVEMSTFGPWLCWFVVFTWLAEDLLSTPESELVWSSTNSLKRRSGMVLDCQGAIQCMCYPQVPTRQTVRPSNTSSVCIPKRVILEVFNESQIHVFHSRSGGPSWPVA